MRNNYYEFHYNNTINKREKLMVNYCLLFQNKYIRIMSKTVKRLCSEYRFNLPELIKVLKQICVDRRKHRRTRREAYQKLEELEFLNVRNSYNEHLISETDSDFSDSSVSSASSASSVSSFDKKQLWKTMGLTKISHMEERIKFDRELCRIKTEKQGSKTHAKKEDIRRRISERKASKKASEAKELHDAITIALRRPIKHFYFLLQHAGFQKVFWEDQYAFVWINRSGCYDIVLFKGVSSPNEADILREIGQSAWFHMKSPPRFDLVYSEIVKFKSPEQVKIRKQAELEKQAELKKQAELEKQADIKTSEILQSIFDEANTENESNDGVKPTCVIM